MSYIITFFDKETLIVSDEQGLKIQEAKVKEVKNFRIGEDLYSTGGIAKIQKMKHSNQPGASINFPPMLPEPLVKKETLQKVKEELHQKFRWPTTK